MPAAVERTLANGLTVIVDRAAVGAAGRAAAAGAVRPVRRWTRRSWPGPALLSQTLFSGTADMSTVDIAAALQTVGGALSAGVDADRLLVSGNGLAGGLRADPGASWPTC